MADGIFNISKGAFVEKFRDAASNGIVALLTSAEADGTLIDHDDLSALLGAAGNTEMSDASYGRKTGLTGSITVDDSNDRAEVDFPDQTWTSLSGSSIVKLLTAYEESASDSGRVPTSHHDFSVTPDGSDVTAQFAASGWGRAS